LTIWLFIYLFIIQFNICIIILCTDEDSVKSKRSFTYLFA